MGGHPDHSHRLHRQRRGVIQTSSPDPSSCTPSKTPNSPSPSHLPPQALLPPLLPSISASRHPTNTASRWSRRCPISPILPMASRSQPRWRIRRTVNRSQPSPNLLPSRSQAAVATVPMQPHVVCDFLPALVVTCAPLWPPKRRRAILPLTNSPSRWCSDFSWRNPRVRVKPSFASCGEGCLIITFFYLFVEHT